MGAPKVSNGKVVHEPLFTKEFWSRTFTQAIHAAAGGALSIFTTKEFNLTHGGSWVAMAVGALSGLIGSGLLSLTSQGVPNTQEASFLPISLEKSNGKGA